MHLKADGTIENEREGENGVELGLVCSKCHEKYWMRIEFAAERAPSISVSTCSQYPTLKSGKVKPVEVYYSREKKWWFSKRGGKVVEIGPGEPRPRKVSERKDAGRS